MPYDDSDPTEPFLPQIDREHVSPELRELVEYAEHFPNSVGDTSDGSYQAGLIQGGKALREAVRAELRERPPQGSIANQTVDAIQQLDETSQMFVVARFYRGMSTDELAKALNTRTEIVQNQMDHLLGRELRFLAGMPDEE